MYSDVLGDSVAYTSRKARRAVRRAARQNDEFKNILNTLQRDQYNVYTFNTDRADYVAETEDVEVWGDKAIGGSFASESTDGKKSDTRHQIFFETNSYQLGFKSLGVSPLYEETFHAFQYSQDPDRFQSKSNVLDIEAEAKLWVITNFRRRIFNTSDFYHNGYMVEGYTHYGYMSLKRMSHDQIKGFLIREVRPLSRIKVGGVHKGWQKYPVRGSGAYKKYTE